MNLIAVHKAKKAIEYWCKETLKHEGLIDLEITANRLIVKVDDRTIKIFHPNQLTGDDVHIARLMKITIVDHILNPEERDY